MGVSAGVTIDLSGQTITSNAAPISATSLIATKALGLTYTLVSAGAASMVGRKNLSIQNNSLNAIYIGNATTVSKTSGILITSGSSIELSFNPAVNTDIYGIAVGIPASISITEV
jgi:hypothetical protein